MKDINRKRSHIRHNLEMIEHYIWNLTKGRPEADVKVPNKAVKRLRADFEGLMWGLENRRWV